MKDYTFDDLECWEQLFLIKAQHEFNMKNGHLRWEIGQDMDENIVDSVLCARDEAKERLRQCKQELIDAYGERILEK